MLPAKDFFFDLVRASRPAPPSGTITGAGPTASPAAWFLKRLQPLGGAMRWLPKTEKGWWRLAGAALLLVVLWVVTAYPRGMAVAYFDHARGHDEVKRGGPGIHNDPGYRQLLRERYGVEVGWGEDCSIWPWFWEGEYFSGYNSVSESFLRRKYGKNVTAECAEEYRRQVEEGRRKKATR
jgi:hypothetical protein